jgi:hypothetical protein
VASPEEVSLKRRKRGKRTFAVSFAIVLGALVIGSLSVVYLGGQVVVNHFPSQIPSYVAEWGKYVPSSFLEMGLENFSYSRSINASVPPAGYALQLIAPDENISSSDVTMLLTITLTVPNQTVDIAFLTHTAFVSVNSSLAGREKYSNMTSDGRIYFVGARLNATTIEFGWLAPVAKDSAVAFGAGYGSAQSGVEEILATLDGTVPSILTLPNIDRALYLAGGPTDHLAIGFLNFAGVVRTSNLTATVVDLAGTSLSVSNIVGFNSTQTAVSQYGYVKSVYKEFHEFTVYDEYVKISGTMPLSQLEAAIRMVE